MTKSLAGFLMVAGVSLLPGCLATKEVYPLPADWSKALPTNHRLPITGLYADKSPDMIGRSTTHASLGSSLLDGDPVWQKYDGSSGPIESIDIVEGPDSILVTAMNSDHRTIVARVLKKDSDYRVDATGMSMSHTADLRSGEGGSIVRVTEWLARREDGALLIKTTEVSHGGIFEQWYRFGPLARWAAVHPILK